MRLVWLNCNKRACGRNSGLPLIRYLQEQQPTVACFSELKREERDEEFFIDGYSWAFHSRNVGILVHESLDWEFGCHFTDFFASIVVDEYEIASVYLDSSKGGKRRKTQIQALRDHAGASFFSPIYGGDFNTVTRGEDSVFNGQISKWVGPGERRLIDALLDDSKLSDPYLNATGRPLDFSFVGSNRGRPFAFRSDFVLCRTDQVSRLHIIYDETPRSPYGFTDHSAVIGDFELGS